MFILQRQTNVLVKHSCMQLNLATTTLDVKVKDTIG